MSHRALFYPTPFVILLTLLLLSDRAPAQRRVDSRNFGERLVLIVPMVGDGTARNPLRPLFVTTPEEGKANGIVSYTSVLSDDKKFALVEFVADNRKAFDAILRDARTDIKKFDHTKGAKKDDIEFEFRKHKKNFDFAKFKEGK